MAIHLEFSVDCRSRQASFAMTNQCVHSQRSDYGNPGSPHRIIVQESRSTAWRRDRTSLLPLAATPRASRFGHLLPSSRDDDDALVLVVARFLRLICQLAESALLEASAAAASQSSFR